MGSLIGIIIYLPVFYLIYLLFTWVNKFFSLKQEQNDLLREMIKKIDAKADDAKNEDAKADDDIPKPFMGLKSLSLIIFLLLVIASTVVCYLSTEFFVVPTNSTLVVPTE